jgi:hypothetical protein
MPVAVLTAFLQQEVRVHAPGHSDGIFPARGLTSCRWSFRRQRYSKSAEFMPLVILTAFLQQEARLHAGGRSVGKDTARGLTSCRWSF